MKLKTPTLRSDLCDYSDAYIVVKETITVKDTVNANKRNKNPTFKNNAPFILGISKINNPFINNAEILILFWQCVMY